MANPWLKKNPFMSAWLSAANAAAGTARGKATAAVRRQSHAAMEQAGKQAVDFWTTVLTGAAKPPTKRRAKR